ncbi:flagellar protein FlaG [Alteromonas gracilis]|uniref:flagellar protein FlaG n=1 Tax=Alteromonas gracilis TaxID=1479524 RepID=UPI003736ADC5
MEIQNTQSGQAFASTTSIAPVREKAPLASELKTESDDQGQFANSNQQAKTDDLAASEKNISQAFVQQADSSNVERKGAQLDEAVAKVESFLKVQNRDLAFSIDDETNRSVVTVKDSQSGDVIRQIPSEDVLKLAERIQELQQDVGNSVGVFINNQV